MLERPTRVLFLLLAVLLVACGAAAEDPATSEPSPEPQASAPAAAAPASPPHVTGAATIATADSDDYGTLLTDGEQLTLYVFFDDSEDQSTCYDACADNWPPVLTDGEPQAEGDVDGALLGTAPRDDGGTQATYDGQPLYYYSGDTAPGDVLGFGSGNVWYPVAPDGVPLDIAASRSEDGADGGY